MNRAIYVFVGFLMLTVCGTAQAQFSAPCDRFSFFCNGSINVGLSYNGAGAYSPIPGNTPQQNRDGYVAQQISNALNSANSSTYYIGATFLVTYADGSTEKYKFTGDKSNGNAEAVPGTKTPPTNNIAGDSGSGCYYQLGTTLTFYLTTIWYKPSTGEIVDISSVPFDYTFGGGSYCV